MKFENVKEKIADFCRRVGKRNFIIVGAVALTVIAVGVNLIIFANNKDDSFNYDQSAGMDIGDSQASSEGSADESVDSYFSGIQVSRQRTRDEAIEVLQSVVDNESATEAAKTEALLQINKLADVMAAESNIETLIVAKGFEECVAVISDGSASIVVKSEQLLPAQISQINEIVYEQAGIEPVNIKIIHR